MVRTRSTLSGSPPAKTCGVCRVAGCRRVRSRSRGRRSAGGRGRGRLRRAGRSERLESGGLGQNHLDPRQQEAAGARALPRCQATRRSGRRAGPGRRLRRRRPVEAVPAPVRPAWSLRPVALLVLLARPRRGRDRSGRPCPTRRPRAAAASPPSLRLRPRRRSLRSPPRRSHPAGQRLVLVVEVAVVRQSSCWSVSTSCGSTCAWNMSETTSSRISLPSCSNIR